MTDDREPALTGMQDGRAGGDEKLGRTLARWSSIFGLASLLSCTTAVEESGSEELLGWWLAEVVSGPAVSGSLEIEITSDRVQAQIGEHRVSKDRSDASFPGSSGSDSQIVFELEGGYSSSEGLGGFRGALDPEAGIIRGHWIQPPSFGLSYPHATPVALERQETSGADGGRYVGIVRPLVDRLRFGMHVRPGEDGGLNVVLRNPELNLGLFVGWQTLSRENDGLVIRNDDGEVTARGQVVEDGDEQVLSLEIPARNLTLRFSRAASRQDLAFVLPSLDEAPYTYEPPQNRPGDDDLDWEVAHASDVGLDPERLQDLIREIRSTELSSPTTPYLHAITIARRGKLVLEETFHGHGKDEPHDTRSAGKSLASMLVGILAEDAGFDESLRFVDAFGELSREPRESRSNASFDQRQEWRGEMTLAHLLSMSSGLDCDDDDAESPGNEGIMQDQSANPDWTAYGLALPMMREPGTEALYCSNSINLAAAAAARVAGRWLPDVFAERIAKPLSIDHYHFNLSPAGDGYMGGGIRIAPRDLAKLGQVMMQLGVWKDLRVLDEHYAERSLLRHSGIHEPHDYALGWWLHLYETKSGRLLPSFYASGNGGQLIIVIPTFDMVVQFSAANYRNYGTWRHYRDDLVPRFILDAVRD